MSKGIFRKRWEYTPRRKIPTTAASVPPDVSTTLISRVHPSKNRILRDGTFRVVLWQYYSPKRAMYTSVFVPGITNIPPIIHPSRNPRLRDSTFRPPFLDYYQPRKVLPPSLFVPGTLWAKQRNVWARKADYRYYKLKRVLPPSITPVVSVPIVSKVHPSKNARLRDKTFREASREFYQRKLVIPPALFVPGITNAPPIVHPKRNPRLRDSTFRPPWLEYYQPKKVLYPSQFLPGTLPAKHPGQNIWDRKTDYRYYRLKRVLPPSIFVPGIIVLISKVYPSRNLRLRDKTFRPPFRNYYKPKYLYLNVTPFVGGIPDAMFKRMYKGMFKRMEPY